MSLRAADARFLLPDRPRLISFMPTRPGMEADLPCRSAARGSPIDLLCVANDRRAVRSQPARADRALIVEGGVGTAHRMRRMGWSTTRYFARSGPEGPSFIGLDDAVVRRYVAQQWLRPINRVAAVRNRVLGSVAGSLASSLVVGIGRRPVAGAAPPPYPLRLASEALGLPAPRRWFLQLGRGDELQRIVAVVFVADDTEPDWVLKFSRLPGGPARADAEERALGALRVRAPRCALQASDFVGRLSIDDADATVERAAVGSTLTSFLRTVDRRTAERSVDRMVAWAIELGAASARRRGMGTSPATTSSVDPADAAPHALGEGPLLATPMGAPAVIAHNDLASWNIVTDGTDLTVVDWESAEVDGFPLWDVAYLATDLLCELHGPGASEARPQWCSDLWRNRLPESSPLLRRWLDGARRAIGLPAEHVGPLVAASWLHHSRSKARRSRHLPGRQVAESYLQTFAERWCDDPLLGLDWAGFDT